MRPAFEFPNRYRIQPPGYPLTRTIDSFGAFDIPSPIGNYKLGVIVSDGEGWDHVSVSLSNRCPNWPEMCHIKSLFFRDDEVVVQYHPAKKDYVNFHPHCLHLWRWQGGEFPKPEMWMVGPNDRAMAG